ncbi:MAG: archease, partial [Thermoprotei archaeon]
MGGFKFLEHMSDAYIMAWGKTLEEAFEYAALGMFETMTDTSKVKHKVVREIEVDGIDLF